MSAVLAGSEQVKSETTTITTTTTNSSFSSSSSSWIAGKIVRKKKFRQNVSLAIQNENAKNAVSIPILIDRNRYKDCLVWCVLGAWIRVQVSKVVRDTDQGQQEKTCTIDDSTAETSSAEDKDGKHQQQHFTALNVELLQCAPDPNAVLLCLQLVEDNTLPLAVVSPHLEHLYQVTDILQAPREIQRRAVAQLVRQLNGVERVASQRIPHTRRRHLKVLERLEEQIPLAKIYKHDNSADETEQSSIVTCPFNLPETTSFVEDGSSSHRRVRYLQDKKWPQIQWIVQRLQSLQQMRKFRHVLDVGGGRGDLATAIALALEGAHVTVVDFNQSSLQAGKTFAQQLSLNEDRMTFQCADFAVFCKGYTAKVNSHNDKPPIDAVVALHACGDLSDLALQFASQQRATFVICPCCYTKRYIANFEPCWIQRYKEKYYFQCQPTNNDSEVPSDVAMTNNEDGTGNIISEEEASDSNRPLAEAEAATIQRLAELNERPEISHRAMHVINSLRLQSLRQKEACRNDSDDGGVHLEEYENTISKRNLVLVGNAPVL